MSVKRSSFTPTKFVKSQEEREQILCLRSQPALKFWSIKDLNVRIKIIISRTLPSLH